MFWSKLFKKKNKIFNTEIVNNVSSKIPSFEELTIEEQEYVNKLKEEYLNFYENEDNYVNLDSELFNEIKMYQDLAVDIMHNDHFGNIVSSIIDSKKLVYYSHKITEINNTLKYKYIALNELRKDKKYLAKHMGLYVLGRRKINILKALDHQINIINNMFVIADQKITDYCACAIANYPKNIDETTEKELDNRYIEVEKDYKDLFNTSINLDDNLTNTDKTTYIEILIDKFIYENKDLIDKLKEQLALIANSEIKDKTMQQEIIDNLMKIKMYYNIFNKYGRNKLTKEDFEELYQIIFNVYTYFPFNNGFKNYCEVEANKEELKLYNHILQLKLEMFLLKKSKIFETNIINDKIYSILLEIFNSNQGNNWQKTDLPKDYLIRDSFNIIEFENLDLLLALDYPNGFDLYFNEPLMFEWDDLNFYIDKYTIKKELYKYILGSYTYVDFAPYDFKLFSLLYKDKINFNILPFLSETCCINKFNDYIFNSCDINENNKTNIYLPDKTKKLYIDYLKLKVVFLTKVYLNNGLNELIFEKESCDSPYTGENVLIVLPEEFNGLRINFKPCTIYNYEFARNYRRIVKNCGSIMLPPKVFYMEDNEENNKILFKYLYNLFYGLFKDWKFNEGLSFSNILNELVISEKYDFLQIEYLSLTENDDWQKEEDNIDTDEAYKKAIKDYIKTLNGYKKYVKSQYIYEEKQISKEPKKLIKKS